MSWQPIETAPKDRAILCFDPRSDGIIYVVRWAEFGNAAARRQYGADGYWVEAHGEEDAMFKPTHWMPLPEPPEAQK